MKFIRDMENYNSYDVVGIMRDELDLATALLRILVDSPELNVAEMEAETAEAIEEAKRILGDI